MRQNGSNLNGRSGARPTARRDLGQLPSGQRRRHRKPGAMYLNHSRGFSDRSARIGNSRTPRRSSRLPYALIAVGCALVLFIAAVVGYVNRSVDVDLNGQETAVRVGSTLQNLIDEQELTDTYDAGDLLAVDDSVLTRHGGEKLSVKVDGKRIKQGKWKSRELTGGEKVTVKDGRDTYEKHEVQATVIEPKLKVEGTGAIEYVQTWGVQGRSEVWVGERSGKTQDRGEVVPATDCVVACASVAPKGNKKYVALTFDEGPSGATKQILQVLKEKGVTATFFLSGDAAEAFHFGVQGAFELAGEAAGLVVEALVQALVLVLLQLAPDHQAGRTQQQQKENQGQTRRPGRLCAHRRLRGLCVGDSTVPRTAQRMASTACHSASLTGITDSRLPRCTRASSASAGLSRRRASGSTRGKASTNSTSSALQGFFSVLALASK